MQQFVDNLQLSPRWWWGIIGATVLVALIFFAAGSKTATLVCLVCAAAIAWVAWSSGQLGRERRGATLPR